MIARFTTSILFVLLLIVGTSTKNITIAIIGTNDIHGTAFPTEMKRSDTEETYMYGGLHIMGGLINIIK